jgi:hypothetical protein
MRLRWTRTAALGARYLRWPDRVRGQGSSRRLARAFGTLIADQPQRLAAIDWRYIAVDGGFGVDIRRGRHALRGIEAGSLMLPTSLPALFGECHVSVFSRITWVPHRDGTMITR